MKCSMLLCCLLALLISLYCFMPSALAAEIYEHEETGVSFVIPEGWEEKPLHKEREYIDVKFMKGTDGIFYGRGDLWSEMTDAEKAGLSRADISNSIFTEADIEDMYGSGTVTREYHGGIEYFVWEGEMTGSSKGITLTFETTTAIHINNGYMYMFMYQAITQSDDGREDFIKLLDSVEYANRIEAQQESSAQPAATYTISETTSSYRAASSRTEYPGITAKGIILSLLLTVAVYSLPIAIYRYGIRKRPMEKQKAKRVTIIYGIAAFIVMMLIISALGGTPSASGAIFLWSGVNYAMLTKGRNTSGVDVEPVETDETDGT